MGDYPTCLECVSIHAPVGGRDSDVARIDKNVVVSIHAPVGGRDKPERGNNEKDKKFQSTRPWEGAT